MLATTTLELEQETNPWTSAAIRFDQAAAQLKLDDGICKVLKSAAREITVPLLLGHTDIRAAVLMGPSAWQAAARGSVARIDGLPDPLTVTLSVTLSVWAAADR